MDKEKIDFTDEQLLRLKAEEELNKKQEILASGIVETDSMKLLHELQVHQIELEMQNEELRQANATAEEALKKFTMLYDFAPIGYFTLDKDGNICELNFTGADILGEKRFSLINSNFKLFVSEAYKTEFDNFIEKVYFSSTKESCEVILGYNGKTFCRAYMEGVVTDEDQKCQLSVVDISGFKI